jgi:hypothetical protein
MAMSAEYRKLMADDDSRRMPNRFSRAVEERIVSFSLAHPGLGPRRIASELAREKWGAIVVSPSGVWRVLCRHGLNTRARRVGKIAGSAASFEPLRDRVSEQRMDVEQPGGLVGVDCFHVGGLGGTVGAMWQLTAIDVYSSYAWAELVVCKHAGPTVQQTSGLVRRVARELKNAGWRLERVVSDDGGEFGQGFTETVSALGADHTRARSGSQVSGHVAALYKTMLEECWRPVFAYYVYPCWAGLSCELDMYLRDYNEDRVHHGRLTRGRIPIHIVHGTGRVGAR